MHKALEKLQQRQTAEATATNLEAINARLEAVEIKLERALKLLDFLAEQLPAKSGKARS